MLLAGTGMGMHLQLMNPSTIHFRQLRYRFISRKLTVAAGPPIIGHLQIPRALSLQ